MKNNKRYEATFLPEIAAEEGWNQQETIKNLIRKSGYPGSLQAIGELNLTTY
jgi:AMMECR1 domain-containing protein